MIAIPLAETKRMGATALCSLAKRWRNGWRWVNYRMLSETIELRGHFIDSLILPKILDQILQGGGSFKIDEIRVGQNRVDQSYARVEITAESNVALDEIVSRLREHGAEIVARNAVTSDDAAA